MQERRITGKALHDGTMFTLSFLCILAVVLTPLTGCKKSKIYTIGLVSCNPRFNKVMDGLKSGLVKKGFVEGKNINYVDRIGIRCEDAEAEMNNMVRNKVDLIFVSSSQLAIVAKSVTANSRTPVVFTPVHSALKTGIAMDLRNPGGNITGVQTIGSIEKAIEWHRLALPAVKKILVPYNQSDLSASGGLDELQKAADKMGITLVARRVESPAELRAVFANIPPATGAIWLLPSNFLDSHYQLFLEASKTHRLPVSTSTAVFSSIKPFLSYGPDLEAMGEQGSRHVVKILKGIIPGDIPIEQAEYFLKINMAVAGELGIAVPEEILRRADEIIR